MTAATVEATTLADELALETRTAIRLAAHLEAIPDIGHRRHLAAQAAAGRRQELALAQTLIRERFGAAPPLADLERDDEVLIELTLLAIA